MAFHKNNFSRMFSKDVGQKLIGAGKGLAHLIDEPLVQAGISALSPEIGAGLAVAKRLGVLEKVKHI